MPIEFLLFNRESLPRERAICNFCVQLAKNKGFWRKRKIYAGENGALSEQL